MKIAIIGYGRMGRLVEEVALDRGHEIGCIIDAGDEERYESAEFRSCDVAIQFSTPSTAEKGLLHCFRAGVPVVSGTTGWSARLPEMQKVCNLGEGTLLWSSNFSIGMNVFMALNRYLAGIMESIDSYRPEISETHHIHKLDHPSGTAVTLAEELVERVGRLSGWKECDREEATPEGKLPVYYERRGEVPGIHSVRWESDVDSITLTHDAKSRRGFAVGAVVASEWLRGRNGFFTMKDVFPFLNM